MGVLASGGGAPGVCVLEMVLVIAPDVLRTGSQPALDRDPFRTHLKNSALGWGHLQATPI